MISRTLMRALVSSRIDSDQLYPIFDESSLGVEISSLSKLFMRELIPISAMIGAFAAFTLIRNLESKENRI